MVGRKLVGWISACSVIALAGCNQAPAPPKWTYTETVDPISQVRRAEAKRGFVPQSDGEALSEIAVTCNGMKGAGPFGLFVTLTSYGAKAKDGTNAPAKIVSDGLEYRIDSLGGSTTAETEQVESPYNNEFKANFAALVGGSPSVSMKLMKALETGGSTNPAALVLMVSASATATEAIEQGKTLNPDKTLAALLGKLVDDPGLASNLGKPMGDVTANYRWNYQTLTLRYRAEVQGDASTDLVVEIPLQDPEVVRVAEACGWMRNPAPASAAALPSAPAGNNTVEVANAVEPGLPQPDRPATCDVDFGGSDGYRGECLFSPFEGNGSFLLTRAGDQEIIANTDAIRVTVIEPGRARVSLSNSSGAGHNELEDAFVRRGSCWVQETDGEDAPQVCVR